MSKVRAMLCRLAAAAGHFGGFAVPLSCTAAALARPGGGQTFGSDDFPSGGGGGGGGNDDGSAELIIFLIRLVIAVPELGVPVLLIAIFLWWKAQRNQPSAWTSRHASTAPAERRARPASQVTLKTLYDLDPDFSRVIFDDFCFRLYASSYGARANPQAMAALGPYLSEHVRSALVSEPPQGVPGTQVVVGALRISNLALSQARGEEPAHLSLTLNYEANVSFGSHTTYRRERWILRRPTDARTKPPEETARLGCPNCGAPFESSDGRRCAYCNQVVADGKFGWQVAERQLLSVEARPPALTSNVREQGTHRPTLRDPELGRELAALHAEDVAVTEPALEARVRYLYDELNRAWSSGNAPALRALTSDGMFDYLRYWLDAYGAQNLHNSLEGMRITRLEFAKVVRDKHFRAVTVRLWGTGRDYTRDVTSGRIVSGSASEDRVYSEYWTLIRGAGVRGPSHNQGTCPSCAAPLTISMAGTCSHCGSHLTRGEFDWVLSKIEQDDVYEG
jgi:hypothetical protein